MPYEFQPSEIKRIEDKYPGLKLSRVQDDGKTYDIWEGKVHFDRTYHGYRIIDDFDSKIDILSDYPESLPLVYEVGGRAKKVAKKWGVEDLRDIHFNPHNGTLCLCVKQEEKAKFPPSATFIDFVEDLVIPYFYGLVYFEENGKWPWKEYSHGTLGLLEYHAENSTGANVDEIRKVAVFIQADIINRKRIRQHLQNWEDEWLCLCGSKNLFSDCHQLAWRGLKKLKKDIDSLRLNPYKLLQPKNV